MTAPGVTAARELDALPALASLYAKAAVSAIGRSGDALPAHRLVVRNVPIDAGNLAAYNRVCGFRLTDHLPPTYPHILAFPLAVALMTDAAFPFALPGLVHIANRITAQRPLRASEPLTVTVGVGNLRAHRRGRQFDIDATASTGDHAAWTSTSTYLHREAATEASSRPAEAGATEDLPTEVTARWRLPGDTGRRYAGVSSDRNPIHMSALSARLFGFPRAVAHGMWTKARCLAALDRHTAEPCEITVEFAKPVLLPGTAELSVRTAEAGAVFALRAAGGQGLHLHGRITR